jgi:hypothetical protein
MKLGIAALAAVRKRRTLCPRESALLILSTQVLEYRDSAWMTKGLLIEQTDSGIHLRLHRPDGQIMHELFLGNRDLLSQMIRLKMTMAVRRFKRRAA